MRTARLILTFREDLIPHLRDFYVGGGRTDLLVVAYNASMVDPHKFTTNEKFQLVPYQTSQRRSQSISGLQYKVWVEVAKKFPHVEGWVVHDYDFYCNPNDSDLFSHIKEDEYGMIGMAFPVWREDMGDTNIDTYPFPQSHRYWHNTNNPIDREVDAVLTKTYPAMYGGTTTLIGGYSDCIVTSSRNLLLLDDPAFEHLSGGLEQVPHTVWRARNVKPVDFRQFYKVRVLMDVLYVPIDPHYDMLNPVKVWDTETGASAPMKFQNFKLKLKKIVKRLIRYEGWR